MNAQTSSTSPLSSPITTVLGPVPISEIGVTDAHSHLWIDPIVGAAEGSPVLTGYAEILAELADYRQAGGSAVVDCQPGGCGRNGERLIQLAQASGIYVIACTGFHRTRYYAPNFWLWQSTPQQAGEYFLSELRLGLAETRALKKPALAGFIKVACEAVLGQTPPAALEGAAIAAAASGCAVEIHTERGQDAENIVAFFERHSVPLQQVVLCHMDKRPDIGLHRELARAGVGLEYDTFYRPKYDPDQHVWPLIESMVEAGFAGSLCLATDMAETALWKHLGGGAGMPGFLTIILPRLYALGFQPSEIAQLMGKNILRRLSLRLPQSSIS